MNEQPTLADTAILDLNGTLLIPGANVALFDVSRWAADGSRLVLLDLATLRRIDARLILSRDVPATVGGESRLLRPTTRVGELLHRRGSDSVDLTVRAEPEPQGRRASTRSVPPSGVARFLARWWDELWNAIYRLAAAACDELPL